MCCFLCVCQFGLSISLTTRPIAFPFIVNLLIGPRKVYNCFWGGYLHPPKINLHGKKILSSPTSKKKYCFFLKLLRLDVCTYVCKKILLNIFVKSQKILITTNLSPQRIILSNYFDNYLVMVELLIHEYRKTTFTYISSVHKIITLRKVLLKNCVHTIEKYWKHR